MNRITHASLLGVQMYVGCSGQPLLNVSTEGDGFFDRPWPSDIRTINGRPDLSDWPERADYPVLDNIILEAETLDGFGTNSSVYFKVDGDISCAEELKTDREDPVILLNISPSSENYGSQIPISLHLQPEETHWQPEGLLSITPYIGIPLEPATQYAAVLTKQCFHPSNQEPNTALDRAWINIGNDLNDISVFTVFTTQNPIFDMANIANRINNNVSTPALDQELTLIRDRLDIKSTRSDTHW